MDESDLATLIRRAQERDPEAFDALVEAYSRRLYGYLYRLTGSRDDADDLLQEVFVRVVRTIDRYQHNGRFEAWLFRIATNLVRDRVRRLKRRGPTNTWAHLSGTGAEESAQGFLESQPSEEESMRPEARLEKAEASDQLQSALGRLPEGEREVIMLRHFSEMSFKEVAEATGTPIGTALARAHRGLAKLRQWMEAPADVH
jgi:RNA polymerase sigma-70 factor (ECF subfamily)